MCCSTEPITTRAPTFNTAARNCSEKNEHAAIHARLRSAKGKGRQFKTLGFHSLRHTFVSELANADVPADVRRQISGHSDEKIHERYTHLDMQSKERALAKLRPLIRNKSPH
jgi:integrase